MPNVVINALLRVNQTSFQKTEKEAGERFTKMGREAADNFAKGYETAAPRIRKAANSVADATISQARADETARKNRQAYADVTERATKLEEQLSAQRREATRYTETMDAIERDLANTRREANRIDEQAEVLAAKKETQRAKLAKISHELTKEELLLKEAVKDGTLTQKERTEYELAVTIPLAKEKNDATKAQNDLEREYNKTKLELSETTERQTNLENQLKAAKAGVGKASKDADDIETELNKTRERANSLNAASIRQHEDVEKAVRRRTDAIKSLHEAEKAEENRNRSKHSATSNRGGGGVVGSILTDLPFVPGGRAGAIIGGGAITALASVAEAAVTASQTVALLPAVATAAGAAFGTLAIGVSGFSDAIKHMGDPKKFAEDVASLSPAAQQAALEIKALVDGPLGGLKNMIQDKLFAGVAEQFHNLTGQFLPSLQRLTGGLADVFNNMGTSFAGVLSGGQGKFQINDIIDNIVKAFQHLEPVIKPVTDAFLTLTQVGASFLPGLADGISNAANSFANFINTAAQNGSLKDFIQKGIDAASTLGGVLLDIGQKIYQVFGNKSPEEFKATLDGVVDTVKAIADAVVGLSHFINDLLKVITPVTDALGGWENAITLAAGAFGGFKLMAAGAATDVAAAGTAAGTGFASKMQGALRAAGWVAVGTMIAESMTGAIDKVLDTHFSESGVPGSGKWFYNLVTDPSKTLDQTFDPITNAFNPPKPAKAPLPPPVQGPGIGAKLLPNNQMVPGGGGNDLDSLMPAGGPPGPPGLPVGVPNAFDVKPGEKYTDQYKQQYGGSVGPFDPNKPLPVAPGPKPSDKDIRDSLFAKLDPSQFAVDPYAPVAGLAGSTGVGAPGPGGAGPTAASGSTAGGLPPIEYGNGGKPYAPMEYGYHDVDPAEIQKKDYDVRKDARELQDAMMDLAVRQQDGISTQRDLLEAQEKIDDKKQQLNEHQLALAKAQQGDWKKVDDAQAKFGKLGAGLDKDLGFSKGLPGLADNLVRFIGNLATAGTQAKLLMAGAGEPEKTGFGLFGMFGGGLLGGPASVSASASVTAGNNAVAAPYLGAQGGQYGLAAGTNTGGYGSSGPQFPGWVHQVEQMFGVKASTYAGHQETDRNEAGYAPNPGHENRGIDWSGTPQAMQQFADYLKTVAPALEQVIWNGGGIGSGDTVEIAGGRPQPGYFAGDLAGHGNHVHTRQSQPIPLPGGAPMATDPSGMPIGSPDMSSMSSTISGGPLAGLPLPLPVTIVSGTLGMPNAAPGTPGVGTGQGTGPAPGPGGLDFDALAHLEASDDWGNKKNDKYRGGLQFDTPTWNEFRPQGAADDPADATREQQIQAAMNALQSGRTPQSLWPKNFAALGSGLNSTPQGPSSAPALAPTPPPAPAAGGGGGPGLLGGPPVGPPVGGPPLVGPGVGASPVPGLVGPGAGGGPPGLGQPQGAPMPADPVGPMSPAPPPPGGVGWQPSGKGAAGLGGLPMAALSTAASMIPGGGAAAETAMQLINRTVGFAGQAASIGIQGLMETFGVGDDTGIGDISKSWPGRILGGFAGAGAAIPNSAGASKGPLQNQQPTDAKSAGDKAVKDQAAQQGGPTVHIENFTQAPNRNGQQAAKELAYQSYAQGGRG